MQRSRPDCAAKRNMPSYRDPQMPFGNLECQCGVAVTVRLLTIREGSVEVNRSLTDPGGDGGSARSYVKKGYYLQCQPIRPTVGEVTHVNLRVGSGLALAPQQETLLGSQTLLADVWREDYALPDVSDSETQNDSPYHSENELEVIVNDVCNDGLTLGANVRQWDAAMLDEIEGLAHILEFLDAHLRVLGVFAEGSVADDFLKLDEANTIRNVCLEVLDRLDVVRIKFRVKPIGGDVGSGFSGAQEESKADPRKSSSNNRKLLPSKRVVVEAPTYSSVEQTPMSYPS
ncbi:hypothetical protein BC936DRAFT_139079 [Jimgerdemannia flammicorona]|uniref:Uncharacterized protein n=1 Tax=Jimgerdemannia flammicorona TaxID=994334 RepID=A0A433BAQ0_9FUNG|nr:hypothetical protein BC936DRAFT_139079 [Jimgerdemannia flammicorona]